MKNPRVLLETSNILPTEAMAGSEGRHCGSIKLQGGIAITASLQ